MAIEPHDRHGGRSLTRFQPPPSPALPPTRSLAGGMEEEVRAYVGILRRRARLIAGVFVVVVGLVLLYTWMQPPMYRASALVEIRGAEAAIPSIDGLFAGGRPQEEEIRTYFGLLRSTTLANRVIDSLALDDSEEFNPEGDAVREGIVGAFLKRLIVDPVEESRLVRVTFEAGSPELAAQIANTIVQAYSALRVETREDAARRVAAQADSVEVRLASSEEDLRTFAQEHDLPYLVEEDLTSQITTRLGDLRTRAAEAEGTRYEAQSLYEVAVQDGRIDLVDNEVLNDLKLRLSELRREHARLSATFTDSYPATAEVQRQIEQVEELLRQEQERLASRVESDYRLAQQRETNIDEAIGAQEELANELGPESGDYHVLRQAVLANRNIYANLVDKQRQAEIAAAIGPTDLAVIDWATPPLEPHSPVFAINLGLALMLGLVLGVGTAFGKEVMDDTVQTVDDIPESDHVPVLGMIPALDSDDPEQLLVQSMRRAREALPWPDDSGARAAERVRRYRLATWPRIDVADKRDPTGNALADAFAALRAAVLFGGPGQMRSILVSSCRAGEGKTTVSVNLAMSLATLGNRVLLVDADLRRPAVDRALKLPAGPGLLHCLTNGIGWQRAVQSVGAPGLDVMVAGGTTTRAADFLAGHRVTTLLESVREAYDYVIVDAPALFINAADARLLSQLVDGVVMVVRSRSTPRALVDRIPRTIHNVLGIVVNDLRKDSLPGYFADYFAGYDLPQGLVVDGPAWEPPERREDPQNRTAS